MVMYAWKVQVYQRLQESATLQEKMGAVIYPVVRPNLN